MYFGRGDDAHATKHEFYTAQLVFSANLSSSLSNFPLNFRFYITVRIYISSPANEQPVQRFPRFATTNFKLSVQPSERAEPLTIESDELWTVAQTGSRERERREEISQLWREFDAEWSGGV